MLMNLSIKLDPISMHFNSLLQFTYICIHICRHLKGKLLQSALFGSPILYFFILLKWLKSTLVSFFPALKC